jgi:hypothetical protein
MSRNLSPIGRASEPFGFEPRPIDARPHQLVKDARTGVSTSTDAEEPGGLEASLVPMRSCWQRRVTRSAHIGRTRIPTNRSSSRFYRVGLTGYEPATPWRVQTLFLVAAECLRKPSDSLMSTGNRAVHWLRLYAVASSQSRSFLMGKWWPFEPLLAAPRARSTSGGCLPDPGPKQ